MAKVYESISQLVGKTPLLEIKNYEKENNLEAKILVKLEYFNPNQSVKDRIALAMVEDAEKKGLLKPGYTIVETTSGNTGIGLAAIAAAKGYKFRVYIQDNVSQERFQVIKAFGGETIKFSDEPVIAKALAESNGDFVAAIKAFREQVLSKEENIFFRPSSSSALRKWFIATLREFFILSAVLSPHMMFPRWREGIPSLPYCIIRHIICRSLSVNMNDMSCPFELNTWKLPKRYMALGCILTSSPMLSIAVCIICLRCLYLWYMINRIISSAIMAKTALNQCEILGTTLALLKASSDSTGALIV